MLTGEPVDKAVFTECSTGRVQASSLVPECLGTSSRQYPREGALFLACRSAGRTPSSLRSRGLIRHCIRHCEDVIHYVSIVYYKQSRIHKHLLKAIT